MEREIFRDVQFRLGSMFQLVCGNQVAPTEEGVCGRAEDHYTYVYINCFGLSQVNFTNSCVHTTSGGYVLQADL